MARGYDRKALIRFVSEKTDWGVTDRTVDGYIATARELMREQSEESVADAMARHMAMRNEMYRMAIEAGDLTNARQVAADMGKLQGLYTERVQVDGNLNVDQVVRVYLPDNGREG